MKTFLQLALSIGLIASLSFSLGACQPPAAPPSTSSLASSVGVAKPVTPTVSVSPPSGTLQLQTDGLQKAELRFRINYPPIPDTPSGFKSQALNYQGFSRFQVSIRGIGLPTPLYPAAADALQNDTIAATHCDSTGCQVNTTVTNVPSGENRIAMIVAYDNAGQPIPGSTLATIFSVPTGQANVTVNLSHRSTPVAQIGNGLLQQGLNFLLATLDVNALQSTLDQVMGAAGNFPNFTYTHHPALLDVQAILSDLIAAEGNVTALNPANPAYVNQGGSVEGQVVGLLGNDTVKLRLSDPATGEQVEGNAGFRFENVPAGNWHLHVEAPAGYTVNGAPGNVGVTEGETADLGTLQLQRLQPTVTGLSETSVEAGETLLVNGTHFASAAADNTVVMGGVTVPAQNVSVLSSTQLEVTVPATVPPGATQLSVTVANQTAVNTPALTILPPRPLNVSATQIDTTSFTLNWTPVNGATAYEVYQDNVLVSTTANTTLPLIGLTPSTAYEMEVLAVVGGLDSARRSTTVITLSDWTQGWSPLGPAGENVLAVTVGAESTDRVYFGSFAGGGSQGGIWRCINNVCAQVESAAAAGSVQALAVDPVDNTIVYAGSVTQGVLKSTDGGDTWTSVNTGLGDPNISPIEVRTLKVDPRDPQQVFLGTRNAGVYYSTNGGQSWTQVNTGLPVNDVGSLSIFYPDNPNETAYIYAGTSGAGVYRSVLSAPVNLNWQSINNGLPELGGLTFLAQVDVTVLFHSAFSGRQFGAGTGGCTSFICLLLPGAPQGGYLPGVWRRTEASGGNPSDWVQVGHNGINEYDPEALEPNIDVGLSNMDILDIDVSPLKLDRFYASTRNGIYLSDNEGTRWTAINSGLPANTRVNGGAINPFRFYIATDRGLFRAN